MNAKQLAAGATLPIALLTVAALRAPSLTETSCATVLGSEICTWVTMDGSTVRELGATIPMALVEGVPTDVEMVWPPEALVSIPLPAQARSALGIDHMAVNWEAHGHPPMSFLAQHFDFHFYVVSQEEVAAIDCSDGSKPLSLPAGYALPDIDVPGMGTLVGLCVPRMGMHAMPEGEIAATAPFEASMMLGYYGGEPFFVEPMVSRDLLLRRAGFSLEVPTVEGLPSGVRFPSAFRAEYDDGSDAYRLVFSGFESQ